MKAIRVHGAVVRGVVRDAERAANLPDGAHPVFMQALPDGEEAPSADVLIDTVGGPVLPAMFPLLASGARCVLIGYTAGETASIDLPQLLQRDIWAC